MTSTDQRLFEIHLEHKYFHQSTFCDYTLSLTKESHALFKKYGLRIMNKPTSFCIFFTSTFEGKNRDRESVMQAIEKLQFLLHINDSNFLVYTGNISFNYGKEILWLSNVDEQHHALRASNVLHQSEFVSESDVRQIPDTLHCFGLIEISMGVNLQEDLYIRFSNRSLYWRYIIINRSLLKLEKSAILGKGNKRFFSGPEAVDLPDGSKGIAFTAVEPIAITQVANERFALVDNYDENAAHINSTFNIALPTPDLSSLSNLNIVDVYVYI